MAARISMAGAIAVAGYFGLNPPGFAAQVVALAFGLAASSIFPALMMGIFNKKVNRSGAIWGMISGIGVTLLYVFQYKGMFFVPGTAEMFLGGLHEELVHRHLAECVWCSRCAGQLRRGHRGVEGHRRAAGAHPAPGGRHPRTQRCRCCNRPLITPCRKAWPRLTRTGPFSFLCRFLALPQTRRQGRYRRPHLLDLNTHDNTLTRRRKMEVELDRDPPVSRTTQPVQLPQPRNARRAAPRTSRSATCAAAAASRPRRAFSISCAAVR